jgi:zinc protease
MPAPQAPRSTVQFAFKSIRYPSGLRVIAERDDRMPLVAVALTVGAGSTSDPPGKEGLAHYVAHLAFRSRPFGKSSFRRLLERAGSGSWSAQTSTDATVYHEIVPAQALPEVLRLEGARMLAPVSNLEPETLGIELDVIRSELRRDNETGLAGELSGTLQGFLFPPGHPYARPVFGTPWSLSALTAQDVGAFLKTHYKPSNMTLALAGDIDLDTIQSLLDSTLPAELRVAGAHVEMPRRLKSAAVEPPSPMPGSLLLKEGPVTSPELWIAWSLPRAFDAHTHLLRVLKGAVQAKLHGVEYEDNDLVSVSVSLVPGKDASMLFCRAILNYGSDPEATKERILDRVHGLWRPPALDIGIERERTELGDRRSSAVLYPSLVLISMLREAEDLSGRAVAQATMTHFSGDPTLYLRGLQSVSALAGERFTGFAEKYLNRERARGVLFMPHRPAAAPSLLPLISAPAVDEKDPLPLWIDADRLRGIAPTPGVEAYRRFTLPNGVEVVAGKRGGLPITSVGILFRGGYCDNDRPGKPAAGVAAMLTAHAQNTWQGSPEAVGGHWEKALSDQALRYNLTSSSGNTSRMIAIVAQRVRSLAIDSGAWEHFMRYRLPLLRIRDRSSEIIASRAFTSALLRGHAYGCVPTGLDVEEVSLDDARDWLSATHRPDRAVLAVVGDVDLEAVEKTIRAELGDWKKGDIRGFPPRPAIPEVTSAPAIVTTPRPGAAQFQLRFGCLLTPAKDSAVNVQHDVLAAVVEDRLGRALRDRLGITYGIEASASVKRGGTALLEVNGAVGAGHFATALGVLKETLAGLGQAPVSEDELAWAKMRVARDRAGRFMSNEMIVNALLAKENVGHPMDSIDTFADELSAVTAERLMPDARLCAAGRSALAVVGDDALARAAIKQVWP